jgi:dienelactone hydrolase
MKPKIIQNFLIIVTICFAGISGLAADCTVIKRVESLPESTPWNLAELSKAPDFEWGDDQKVRALYYAGEPYQGHATRVFAYYATPGTLSGDPSKDKNLPAIVLVHGGGGTAFPKWAELWASRGYAAIAMDLTGSGPRRKALPDGGPGAGHDMKFGAIDLPDTEQWTYHAVADVIRAHSLIRSFPEVDADRTAITGISWGGYLTCIVAGLDNRFKAAVPVYGCGFLAENSSWLNEFAKMSDDQVAKWTQLWDPSQYVGSTSVPMLFVNGGLDVHYRPDSHAKTYALVHSPKNLHYVPHLPHGHIFDKPTAIEVFVNHYLKGGVPLARISEPHVQGKQITAMVETQTKLVSAELNFTTDAVPRNSMDDKWRRKWQKQPAAILENQIVADLPPENTTIWFLTGTDDRETIVSSPLVFPGRDGESPFYTKANVGK